MSEQAVTSESLEEALDSLHHTKSNEGFLKGRRRAEEALRQYPNSGELWAIYAECLHHCRQPEEARVASEKAQQMEPDCAVVWAVEADRAACQAEFEQSLQAADRAMQLDDEDPFVVSAALRAYLLSGNADRALEFADRLCAVDDCAGSLVSKVRVLEWAHRHEEAEALLAEAERRFPDSPAVWEDRARLLMKVDRYEEASGLLRKVIEDNPTEADAWQRLADCLVNLYRLDEAEDAAVRALALDQTCVTALQVLSKIYYRRGDPQKAVIWDKKAQEALLTFRDPHSHSTTMPDGVETDWNNVLDEAERQLQTATVPWKHVEALKAKARALVELEQFAEAEPVVAELERLRPGSLEVYYIKGRLCRGLGKAAEAVALLEAGLSKLPREGGLFNELLQAYHDLGAEDKEAALVEDLYLRPTDQADLVYLVAETLTVLEHLDAARRLRRWGLERWPDHAGMLMGEIQDRFKQKDWTGAEEFVGRIPPGFKGLIQNFREVIRRSREIEILEEELREMRREGGGFLPSQN